MIEYRTFENARDYLESLAFNDAACGWQVKRTLGKTVTAATEDDGEKFTITRTITCRPGETGRARTDERWILTESYS